MAKVMLQPSCTKLARIDSLALPQLGFRQHLSTLPRWELLVEARLRFLLENSRENPYRRERISRKKMTSESEYGPDVSSQNIVLFTPWLHQQPPHIRIEDVDMDPFESFGRFLSTKLGNIRHVSYMASEGLTDEHERILDQATEVVVMICQPHYNEATEGKVWVDHIYHQKSFALRVAGYLDSVNTGVLGELVSIGVDEIGSDDFKDLPHLYETVHQLDDWTDLERTIAET